jgi:hypothetical protein
LFALNQATPDMNGFISDEREQSGEYADTRYPIPREFFKDCTCRIANTNFCVPFCFGNVFERNRFVMEQETSVKEIKHTLDSSIEEGTGAAPKLVGATRMDFLLTWM